MNKIVTFIKSNPLDIDTRISKEIPTLKRAGYNIKVICWNRNPQKYNANSDNVEEIALKLNAPFGLKIILFLPVWWLFVFFHVLTLRSSVVHVLNFDSIIPALIASKITKKKIIYEILDVYVDEIFIPKILRNFCLFVDKLFMRWADAIIVADDTLVDGIGGIPNKNIHVIYDSPPDNFIRDFSVIKSQNKQFTLFYAGVLFKARRLNIDKLFEVIKKIDGIKLVIAGYGDLGENITKWATDFPDKIEFLGKISYSDVIKLGSKSNLFFVLRDTVVPANRYICGSTIFNSMICGKPLLANKCSSTADKVNKERCGLVVDVNNAEEIQSAILQLKNDTEFYKQLCLNAKKAYEEKYGWMIMEKRLINLYSKLKI
jgi:glycosyltransferase involved in cell wall biosynthesis